MAVGERDHNAIRREIGQARERIGGEAGFGLFTVGDNWGAGLFEEGDGVAQGRVLCGFESLGRHMAGGEIGCGG